MIAGTHQMGFGRDGQHAAVQFFWRRCPVCLAMGVQLIGVSHYVGDGAYPIESNPIENGIRPVALGRKNWLFARSETAGKRAAAFMSQLATAKAKANGHEPNAWLTDVWLPTTLDRDV